MAELERLSLDELEHESGVSARQIRELIRVGVLPSASSGGRGATYGAGHLLRLRAWKRLRAESPPGTTTEQLRALVDRLEDSGLLRGIADGTLPFSLVDDQKEEATIRTSRRVRRAAAVPAAPSLAADPEESAPRPAHPASRNEDALAYLRGLGGTTRPPARVAMEATTLRTTIEVDLGAAQRSGASLVLARLRTALEDYVTLHAAGVRVSPAKSETWQRVVVGRDVEIVARGPLDADDVHLLETVAQLLQQAIYRRSEKP